MAGKKKRTTTKPVKRNGGLRPARATASRRRVLQAPAAKANDVDAYFDAQAPKTRRLLRRVRTIVKQVAPDAEATIAYAIAGFTVGGRVALYLAGWKTHWSMYPATPRLRKAIGASLDPYLASKGTLKFALDDPMPTHLVQRIVRELCDEAREKGAVKAKAKAKATSAKRATAASPKKRTASASKTKAAPTKAKAKTKTR